MIKSHSATREYVSSFNAVMDAYEDARTANVNVTSEGFYRALANDAGKSDNGFNQRIVRPSLSDFICDVEIVARRVLSSADYKFFKMVYVEFVDVSPYVQNTGDYRRTNHRVKLLVGRAMIARRIHPLSKYFSAKDVR